MQCTSEGTSPTDVMLVAATDAVAFAQSSATRYRVRRFGCNAILKAKVATEQLLQPAYQTLAA